MPGGRPKIMAISVRLPIRGQEPLRLTNRSTNTRPGHDRAYEKRCRAINVIRTSCRGTRKRGIAKAATRPKDPYWRQDRNAKTASGGSRERIGLTERFAIGPDAARECVEKNREQREHEESARNATDTTMMSPAPSGFGSRGVLCGTCVVGREVVGERRHGEVSQLSRPLRRHNAAGG